MPYNPKSRANLHPNFTSEKQPTKRGRRPNKLKKLIKDYDLSKDDVDALFKNLLFDKTMKDLESLDEKGKTRDKLPVIYGLLNSILLNSARKGDAGPLNSMLDRIWGKAIQSLEFTEKTNDIPTDPEERRKLYEQIQAELKESKGAV